MSVRALRRRGDSVNSGNAAIPLALAVPLVPLAAVACVAVCMALLVGGPVSVLWCVAWSRFHRAARAKAPAAGFDQPALKLAAQTPPPSLLRSAGANEREMRLATAA
jgi:hypothetical protein